MENIHSLANKLRENLVDDRHHIVVNPIFDDCSCKSLTEHCLYMYIPHIGAEHYESKEQKSIQNKIKESQEKVKQLIFEYIKANDLKIAVSKQSTCGSFECTGHYEDPFKKKADGKHIFIKEFPENINGAYVYFLKPDHMKILDVLQSKLS